MPAWDFVSAPTTLRVRFVAPSVPILLHSLGLLSEAESLSGLPDWVYKTHQALTEAQRYENRLCDLLMPGVISSLSGGFVSFPQYIQQIEATPSEALREEAIFWLQDSPHFPGMRAVLADEQVFLSVVRRHYAEKGVDVDEALWRDAYAHLLQPARAKERLLAHLRFMWDNFLRVEWARAERQLQEVVKAHNQVNYDGQPWGDVIEQVTNRDLRQQERLIDYFSTATILTCIPTPHLGPYVSYYMKREAEEVLLFFGARLPRGNVRSPELDRADLLVRLNALADETRLRMVELLAQREEICAQDFMSLLELSQSSASRHLRQLTASGFLTERRRDVAKCYSLNRDRVADTIKTLSHLLGGET
ncbi:MAG: metalloregulator ArsR/SmtB family transcription factor [Anaerolineae bacterium]|nr:metalloregulator ArsR/SmtB family transcription factor [Anaerolineae bacterium]MDW8172972.1 metalloregulator ArsR/SmtB family transcription factor [Anaerolineae bacterium]